MIALPSSTVYFVFRFSTSGIADGDWTKILTKNGAIQSQTITITEIATKIYGGSFATDSTKEASWYFCAYDPTSGEWNDGTWLTLDLQDMRKILCNDLTKSGSTVTILDDDKVTPYATFTTSTTERTRT